MFTRVFWVQTLDRVVKTFAEGMVAFLTALGTDLTDAAAHLFLITVLLPTGLALFVSIGSGAVGNKGTTNIMPGADYTGEHRHPDDQ